MTRTVKSAISGPLLLSLADPLARDGSDNPLIVTRTGTITSTGAGTDGISGPAGTYWIISNHGTVASAEGWGISLAGAGVLENSGLISGQYTFNVPGGGVEIGGVGAIKNTGTISGGAGLGVDLAGGGMLTNDGEISGDSGLFGRAGGVEIAGFGVIKNGKNGLIFSGVEIDGPGTVTNQGLISGQAYRGSIGVKLTGGGTVTNKAGGSIGASSPGYAIEIAGGSGTVTNKGNIHAGIGIDMADGGLVTNDRNASISGIGFLLNGGIGVDIAGNPGEVKNRGSITGEVGVQLTTGGTVTNLGTITGEVGVEFTGGGTVINRGLIAAAPQSGIAPVGVEIMNGGIVTNNKDGSITGTYISVEVTSGSGTITNAGTIAGGDDSILFGSGTSNNLLLVDPGAVFSGTVDARGGTDNTIELAKGVGAIGGIGTGQFVGFNTLAVDTGAKWTLSGADTVGTTLNEGTLGVSGSLTVNVAVDPNSSGLFKLASHSTLEVAAMLGISSKISFGLGSELVIDNSALFGQSVGTSHYAGPSLESFGGSTIDIKDFSVAGATASFSRSTGLLQLTNSALQTATLDFQKSSLGSGAFHVNSDGNGGILITHSQGLPNL